MTESYFQTRQRKSLEALQFQFEQMQQKLTTQNEFVRHEQNHPGRIQAFLDSVENSLESAERLIREMYDPVTQKAHWLNFHSTLNLARTYMDMAEADCGVVRDRERQAGTKKPRFQECDDWIDRRLRRKPDFKSPELWQLAPGEIKDRIGFGRFAKRVTGSRQRLGISIKKGRK